MVEIHSIDTKLQHNSQLTLMLRKTTGSKWSPETSLILKAWGFWAEWIGLQKPCKTRWLNLRNKSNIWLQTSLIINLWSRVHLAQLCREEERWIVWLKNLSLHHRWISFHHNKWQTLPTFKIWTLVLILNRRNQASLTSATPISFLLRPNWHLKSLKKPKKKVEIKIL